MTDKVWSKIDTLNMVYGGQWNDAQSTIRATIFAKLVELSRDRVKFYISDLFHDAIWINDNIIGAGGFDWIARESGTHIGEICQHLVDDDWAGMVRYRFDIRQDENGRWVLDTYEAVELVSLDVKASEPEVSWVDRHAALDIDECDVAKAIEGCIFHPAPVGGWTENPTLRNDLTMEPNAPTRKENSMREVKDMLEEKLSDLNQKLEELDDAERDIEDAKEVAQRNIDALEEAINALDLELEDFYISVDVSYSE